MNIKEFTAMLQEELEVEGVELSNETRFDSLEIWDSMAVLVLISLVDEKFQIQMKAEDFKSIPRLGDLVRTIGIDRFDN